MRNLEGVWQFFRGSMSRRDKCSKRSSISRFPLSLFITSLTMSEASIRRLPSTRMDLLWYLGVMGMYAIKENEHQVKPRPGRRLAPDEYIIKYLLCSDRVTLHGQTFTRYLTYWEDYATPTWVFAQNLPTEVIRDFEKTINMNLGQYERFLELHCDWVAHSPLPGEGFSSALL